MSIIGSFSFGSASAVEYSTIEELLTQLPDNDKNLIVAQDVRDSVYTLWQRTNASIEATTYLNPSPTPITVGGIPEGTVFNTPVDMQTIWDLLLYPYTEPTVSINTNQTILEYGSLMGLAEESIQLTWSVGKKTNTITSITIEDTSISITGNSQSGIFLTNGTHSWNGSGISESNIFNITVGDGTSTVIDNTELVWMNKFYWGTLDLSEINNPNLTYFTNEIVNIQTICTDFVIRNLDGAGVGNGSELRTDKNKHFKSINGNGKYLVFAYPSSFIGASIPKFEVNSMISTAFTRIRHNSPFQNSHGYTTNYEVWITNTLQNSPLDITIDTKPIIINNTPLQIGITSQENVSIGSTVCLDITTQNFNDIVSMHFSINFNPSALDFLSIDDIFSEFLSYGSPNQGLLPDGNITISFGIYNLIGVDLPNGSVLFRLCFEALQSSGQTIISFSGSPTAIEIYNSLGEAVPFSSVPSTIGFTN